MWRISTMQEATRPSKETNKAISLDTGHTAAHPVECYEPTTMIEGKIPFALYYGTDEIVENLRDHAGDCCRNLLRGGFSLTKNQVYLLQARQVGIAWVHWIELGTVFHCKPGWGKARGRCNV